MLTDRLLPNNLADSLDFHHARTLAAQWSASALTLPDLWNLMPDEFTRRAPLLRRSVIDPSTPQRDTFCRMMEPLPVEAGRFSSGSVGKSLPICREPTANEKEVRRMRRAAVLAAPLGDTFYLTLPCGDLVQVNLIASPPLMGGRRATVLVYGERTLQTLEVACRPRSSMKRSLLE